MRLERNFLVLLLEEILCPVYVGDQTGGLWLYLQSWHPWPGVNVHAFPSWTRTFLVHFYDFGGCQSPCALWYSFSLFHKVHIVTWTCCHISTGELNWNEKPIKSPHLPLYNITLIMYRNRSWYLPAAAWHFKTNRNGCGFAFLCCVVKGSEVPEE